MGGGYGGMTYVLDFLMMWKATMNYLKPMASVCTMVRQAHGINLHITF